MPSATVCVEQFDEASFEHLLSQVADAASLRQLAAALHRYARVLRFGADSNNAFDDTRERQDSNESRRESGRRLAVDSGVLSPQVMLPQTDPDFVAAQPAAPNGPPPAYSPSARKSNANMKADRQGTVQRSFPGVTRAAEHSDTPRNSGEALPPALPASMVTSTVTRTLPASDGEARRRSVPTDVRLRDIFFYQDYISGSFSDGRSLQSTISELRSDPKVMHGTIPRIHVLMHRGRYYGMGNRRLACYHFVFRNQPDTMIPVYLVMLGDDAELLPQGTGTSVQIGGGCMLDGRLCFSIQHCDAAPRF